MHARRQIGTLTIPGLLRYWKDSRTKRSSHIKYPEDLHSFRLPRQLHQLQGIDETLVFRFIYKLVRTKFHRAGNHPHTYIHTYRNPLSVMNRWSVYVFIYHGPVDVCILTYVQGHTCIVIAKKRVSICIVKKTIDHTSSRYESLTCRELRILANHPYYHD
jgi:hypothetical protein